MVSLHDSLVSSSARQAADPQAARPLARKQQYLGRTYWVVKDPVGLNYYRFQEEEYAILQMLDGETSLDEIKDRFEADFPPQKITLEELQQFLGMLHRSGLVVAGVPGQGRQLFKRRKERRRKEILGALTNLLSVRFKGIDPERFLNWLYGLTSWCFSRTALVLGCLLALLGPDAGAGRVRGVPQAAAGVQRLLQPAERGLAGRDSGRHQGAARIGTRHVLQAFRRRVSRDRHHVPGAHALPVLQRVGLVDAAQQVAAGGHRRGRHVRGTRAGRRLHVPLVVHQAEGLLHYLCLNVMFVCSVSTVLFNGNPLLRYDGYYILADILEIPNLRQKATTILSRKAAHWCLGIEPPEDPFLPERNQTLFAIYAIAAAVYRWVVLASILWFLYQVFKPYGLQILGQALVLTSLVGLVVMPLYKVGKFFYIPGRIEKVKKPRMYVSLGVLAALVLAFLFVPLPHSVICTLEVQPRNAESVYVEVTDGGELMEVYVKLGQRVTAGQKLAKLVNYDLDAKIEELRGEQARYEEKLANLERQSARRSARTSSACAEALAAVTVQLQQKTEDRNRLLLVARTSGTMHAAARNARRDDPEGQLPSWSGTPLDEDLFRPYLEDGVLFCQIGNPQQYEAILVIDQTDLEFVRELLLKGKPPVVDVNLDALPYDTIRTQITQIADTNLKVSPKRLSSKAGGPLATTTDPNTGVEKLRDNSYQARARSTTTKACSASASAAPAASTPPGSRWARGSGGW